MRNLVVLLMLILGCTACENEKPSPKKQAIGFATDVTRSLVGSNEELCQQELQLYGAYTLGGGVARVFDAERLYYNTTESVWDYDNTQYWIMNATYRFCAVSPYSTSCKFSDADGRVTIASYECYAGGDDLLYATAERDLAAGEDYSPVLLHFHHACAAVQFNIINASSQTLLDVRNIRLVGLQNVGIFSFTSAGGDAMWTLDDSVVGESDAEQPFGGVCVLPEGGLPVNISVKHPLYELGALVVLPQKIYKTDVTLHLEYIKEGDGEYAVRNIELGWLGGMTPTEWKAGEKYEYNLTITDNTITAEVRIVDWIDHFVDL